jgi:ferrous iron transport protein A
MPLTSVKQGERVQILNLPSNQTLQKRLSSMGIKPGSTVQVLRRGLPGGILHVASGVLEFMIRHDHAHEMEVSLERSINA